MGKVMMILGMGLVIYGLIADNWKLSFGGVGWMLSAIVWEGG